MTGRQATAEVFFTAFKALSTEEQQSILMLIARDRKLRQILEETSDRLAIEEERNKPSRLLRDYIAARERRGRAKGKARR